MAESAYSDYLVCLCVFASKPVKCAPYRTFTLGPLRVLVKCDAFRKQETLFWFKLVHYTLNIFILRFSKLVLFLPAEVRGLVQTLGSLKSSLGLFFFAIY